MLSSGVAILLPFERSLTATSAFRLLDVVVVVAQYQDGCFS